MLRIGSTYMVDGSLTCGLHGFDAFACSHMKANLAEVWPCLLVICHVVAEIGVEFDLERRSELGLGYRVRNQNDLILTTSSNRCTCEPDASSDAISALSTASPSARYWNRFPESPKMENYTCVLVTQREKRAEIQ